MCPARGARSSPTVPVPLLGVPQGEDEPQAACLARRGRRRRTASGRCPRTRSVSRSAWARYWKAPTRTPRARSHGSQVDYDLLPCSGEDSTDEIASIGTPLYTADHHDNHAQLHCDLIYDRTMFAIGLRHAPHPVIPCLSMTASSVCGTHAISRADSTDTLCADQSSSSQPAATPIAMARGCSACIL